MSLSLSMNMHQSYFIQALNQAEIFRGQCAPNPAVGALIISNGKVISAGFHQGPGTPHAEVVAISQLKKIPDDAILYVTLEPCCHFGRTPPCTDLIIQSKIKKVFFSCYDPNPDVRDKSQKILKAAGVECEYVEVPEITAFYQSYVYWWQTKKPWVTAKLAVSVDGKIAGLYGDPVQITGDALKKMTHQLRKKSDAILTTVKTVNADNPQMNVRLENETFKKPVFILDKNRELLPDRKIFQTARSVTVLTKTDPEKILTDLGSQGFHDIWIEAGGTLFQSWIEQGYVQTAYLYLAHKRLGSAALDAFRLPNLIFSKALKFQWQRCGEDLFCKLDFFR